MPGRINNLIFRQGNHRLCFWSVFCFSCWLFLAVAVSIVSGYSLSREQKFLFPTVAHAQSVDDRKAELRNQLDKLQQEIGAYRNETDKLNKESKTLQRDINLLNNQIRQLELQIQQSELSLKETEILIEQKNSQVQAIEKDIADRKDVLSVYLQDIYIYEQSNLLEIIFSSDSLSAFFEKIQSLEMIQSSLKDSLGAIGQLKTDLGKQKEELEADLEEQKSLQALQEIQQITVLYKQGEKKTLLTETKGEESIFRNLVSQTQKNIDAIRGQLYMLEGVGVSMTLSEAAERAGKVAKVTGIRPAFLLAVLKQESSWGKNVGRGNWRVDMRPQDKDAFLAICKKLGLDPEKMPVSGKPSYGWGGAMGAAQFLPTTWLAYESEIAKATGHNPPSPWDLEDAFAAAAIKLGRDGAIAKTDKTEWKAAMIYFAGSRWNNPVYAFYGDSVMGLARVIQEQLDLIGI